MANRIKGITVEIGGDTTGLDKALKSVNTSIRTTQSALRDVNRLLKLDPSNTNLLTQKQKLLKSAIVSTKEKLDSLRQAQEQAKQQLENGELGQDKYDALQREIIETEQELRRLQTEAATCNSTLSKIDAVGGKMQKIGDGISSAGKKMMGVTAVVGGVGIAAVKTASDFDSAMSQVSAVSGTTGDEFDALRDKAREMGSKTKFSATDAAQAMNYMAMAGWKTGDMLSGIDGIMNLAAASGEDLATTSDIVTDALTAFGLSADDSAHFADILAAASSNANTNVSMMGETFKYCAPIAGALGFSAEDTAEAIGLMANAGIKSSQAGTSLRTIMNNLSSDFQISGKAIGDVTIATTNADGSMRSLSDILADCRTAFGGLTESEKASAAESLVGKNAMSGFLALMNAGQVDIDKLSSAISNCDGSAEQMAQTMQDNLGGQLTILKSQLQELAISFADILMPAIRALVTKLQALMDRLDGMDEGTKKAVLTLALLAASIGPLLLVIGTTISKVGLALQGFVKLANGIGKMKVAMQSGTGVFGKLSAALSGMSAPILAIVAVIAVLVAAFVHLWKTNDGFRSSMLDTWERIQTAVSGFVSGITERLSGLNLHFSAVVLALQTVWNTFCNLLAPLFEGAFSMIATILETALGILSGILDVFIGVFTGDWSQAWNGLKTIVSSVWNGIKGIITTTLRAIRSVVSSVWNAIKEVISSVLGAIKNKITLVWNGAKTIVTTAVNSMKTSISNGFNTAKNTVSTVFNSIKTAITTKINAARNAVKTAIDRIKSYFHFSWSLPKLKLPHFNIAGGFSLNPPSVPKFSVEWYAKAMKHGMILNSPTIFGQSGNSLLAGGEAGSETVVGTRSLMNMIRAAAASGDASVVDAVNALSDRMIAIMSAYYPQFAHAQVVMDSGAVVGELTPAIDAELGRIAGHKGRGN